MFHKLLVISMFVILATISKLYATDTTWTFDTSTDYTYDTSKIEITGGVARLKDLGVTIKDDTIVEYNSAFVAGDTTTRGYSGTAAGADVSLVLETASATLYKPSGTFVSRIFDTASGCGNWQRLNATVINGDIPNADSQFDSGLVSVWHMNGNWLDAKGTNNGVATGATFSTAARLGSHAGYFGGGDYVQTGYTMPTTSFTVEFWHKPSALGGAYAYRPFGSGDSGVGAHGLDYAISNGSGQSAVVLRNNSTNYDFTCGSTPIADGRTWEHVAVTVASSVGAKCYRNGTLSGSNSSGTAMSIGGLTVKIGSSGDAGTRYNGLLDEVAIYNRALSASEVMNHYQNANPGTVKFQCRAGSTVGEVESGEWRGPDSTTATFYESTGADLGYQFDAKQYLQYRMYLQ